MRYLIVSILLFTCIGCVTPSKGPISTSNEPQQEEQSQEAKEKGKWAAEQTFDWLYLIWSWNNSW